MSAVLPPDPLPQNENVGPILVGVSTVLAFVAVLTGGLRLWVRYVHHSLGRDDYLMMIVLPIVIARVTFKSIQVKYGYGRHRWYIDDNDIKTSKLLGWYSLHTLFAGMCLLKCSIMFLLLRIKSTKVLRWGLGAVMVGLVITHGGCNIILLAECRPISAYWTGHGECWDYRIFVNWILITISYSLATDLMCSLLPLVVIWRVRLPLHTKVSVCCLMSLGLVATGFGVIRATLLGIATTDRSYAYAIVDIWTNVEFFLGVIATNLALSRQIYGYLAGKNTGVVDSSSYQLEGSKPSAGLCTNTPPGADTYIRALSTESFRPPMSNHSDIPLRRINSEGDVIWANTGNTRQRDSPVNR